MGLTKGQFPELMAVVKASRMPQNPGTIIMQA